MSEIPCPIGFDADPVLQNRAQDWMAQFGFVLNQNETPRLQVTAGPLVLLSREFSPQWTDFSAATWKHRKQDGKRQGLVRACQPKPGLSIIDATAGWGRDAAILASFGAQVCMIERHPMLAALLKDGLSRQDEASKQHLSLNLVYADAQQYLQTCSPPDVIYMDPMHPSRQKTAKVKKDMQVLHTLVGMDTDACTLLQIARQCARQRVVVKWPQKQAPLMPPRYSIEGKTIRFDVY